MKKATERISVAALGREHVGRTSEGRKISRIGHDEVIVVIAYDDDCLGTAVFPWPDGTWPEIELDVDDTPASILHADNAGMPADRIEKMLTGQLLTYVGTETLTTTYGQPGRPDSSVDRDRYVCLRPDGSTFTWENATLHSVPARGWIAKDQTHVWIAKGAQA